VILEPLLGRARSFTRRCWPLALLLVPVAPASAQQLYMPRDVKAAYAKGTRSPDGRPGPRYWQNTARYTITVTAAPPDRTVRGTEQITYINNSPDTLRTPVIKLLLNIHKPGAPRASGASDAYLTSGMHIDAVTVNGQSMRWPDDPRFFTWHPLPLSAPLLPRDSVRLSFDWHYDIAREANREGVTDSTTFFLAYFYPRVAVFDDVTGWDRSDFTDQLEFYNDFNDYDVTVRVPANFVVWGTGTLLNAAEVLQPTPLQRFQASLTSDQTINVATKSEMAARSVTVQQPTNGWHFRASNIPDMAFNVSDHYVWDAASVMVDSATSRRASVQAAYNDTASDYRHMVRYGRNALDWLSRKWPGVSYPYEKSTIVQGFADMEYPMMVNDQSFPDTVFSRFVAEHEIAHTYFPFYMGINETRYGFMDEGWATALEYLMNQESLGKEQADLFFRQFRVDGWIGDPAATQDVPIITPYAVGNNEYGKPALGYLALKELLGDAVFRKSLHAYIDRWHGKHPIPWDFFNTFNDVSGKNLNWFWNNWYFDSGYIDLSVASVTRNDRGSVVVIENVGGMAAPVDLRVTYSDGSTETLHQTPAIWEANQKRATVILPAKKTIRSVELDGGIWADALPANGKWTAKPER
jgi:hypothetical protein